MLRSASFADFNRATYLRSLADRWIDRVLRNVPRALKLSFPPFSSARRPNCFFILSAVCQVRIITSPARAHSLAVGRHDRKCAKVVKNILRRNRFLADAALGKKRDLQECGDPDGA